MGVQPNDPDGRSGPRCLLEAGDGSDRGGIVTGENERSGTVTAGIGNQGRSFRSKLADVDGNRARRPLVVAQDRLDGIGHLVTVRLQAADETGPHQGAGPTAKALITLIVTVGNNDGLKSHLPAPSTST